MGAAVLKRQFESVLGGALGWQERPSPELLRTGVPEIDNATGGVPRGRLTEIFGPDSSGRTSVLYSILAEATRRGEICAVVDAENAFDPASAGCAGVRLERLLWVRCGHNAEHALRAIDLLVQGGGFGLVALDLGDTASRTARRISLTSWFRLARAVENTPTTLVSLSRESNAKTCAALILECGREGEAWMNAAPRGPGRARSAGRLLEGARVQVWRRKPGRAVCASFSGMQPWAGRG